MADSIGAELDKRRRDLYAVSIAILTFSLSGATFAPQMSVGGVGFLVKSPGVIVWGAWFAYAYFLWRYLLAFRKRPAPHFADEVRMEQHKVPAFRARADEIRRTLHVHFESLSTMNATGKELAREVARTVGKGSELGPPSTQIESAVLQAHPHPEQMRQLFRNLSSVTAHHEHAWLVPLQGSWGSRVALNQIAEPGHVPAPIGFPQLMGKAPSSPTGWRAWALSVPRALVAACVRRDAFGDHVLPIIVASAAPLVVLAQCFIVGA